jgi:hypothetical protein
MKFSHLEEMIKQHVLKIAKISTWTDPYENFIFKSNFRVDGTIVRSSPTSLESFWGQCWAIDNEKNMDAMWKIYSSSKKRIRIKTTLRKLLNIVCIPEENDSAYVGIVDYMTQECLLNWYNDKNNIDSINDLKKITIESLFKKRIGFNYENELRVIVWKDSKVKFQKYTIDIKDFIEEIEFDPRVNPDYYRKKLAILRQSIFSNKIKVSDLYKFKPMTINLNF